MDTYEEANYIQEDGQVPRYDDEQPSLENSTDIPPHISNPQGFEESLHHQHQQFEGNEAQVNQEEEAEQYEGDEEIIPSHQTIVDESELLAAQAAAEAAAAAQQQEPGDVFNNVGQGLEGPHRDMMMQYWQETINSIEHDEHDFKNHQLPLARIKKVMKTDEDVRMISAEAPILFAKGCDVFITELTMRAWIHAEENKRRTLQKSDIAAALTKSDMFDFLIDVVPREEEKPSK
ncbi:HAP5 [Candida theae]|uniref:HAP5 n=1 Tax=Candida theae TaxID=1198502 RepID=A0AAD5BAT2_9ASCO|nr:HAP5 [Candida theae]KAI5949096.1 HAP5 [Candida theae]